MPCSTSCLYAHRRTDRHSARLSKSAHKVHGPTLPFVSLSLSLYLSLSLSLSPSRLGSVCCLFVLGFACFVGSCFSLFVDARVNRFRCKIVALNLQIIASIVYFWPTVEAMWSRSGSYTPIVLYIGFLIWDWYIHFMISGLVRISIFLS